MKRSVLVTCAGLLLLGCSGMRRGGDDFGSERRLSTLRPGAVPAREVRAEVSRARLQSSLEKAGAVNAIRLVSTFRRAEASPSGAPEYRLFDIQPESPYAILGLRNADVLIGVNDYAVTNPQGFRQFVQAVVREPGVTFALRREERPFTLAVSFTD